MYYVLSILLGLIPEVLYFTLFITYAKNIKEKRIKLFLLISISYIIGIILIPYQLWFHMIYAVLIYLSMKLLYKNKTQIIDIFIISLAYSWLLILSFLLMPLVNKDYSNYIIIYIIERILLFLPFIFRNKLNYAYKLYCKLWNRNDAEKRPIKSITLRNISLILLNIFILCMNGILININL